VKQLTRIVFAIILSRRDKFPSRGLKGNSGEKPGLPPQL
jgi:hypothetical protein